MGNKITRIKGQTIIQTGNLTFITNKINRYKYNKLRKLEVITTNSILWALNIKKEAL